MNPNPIPPEHIGPDRRSRTDHSKLDRLQELFYVALAAVGGILCAIYSARLAGNGNFKSLSYIAALIIALLICIKMQRRIWILIPLTWYLTEKSYLLPLPFGVREVAILICFGTLLLLVALKGISEKNTLTFLDFLLGVNLVYLLSAYVRNPVGVSALGTDLIGGRPYYITIISLLGYWVLSRTKMSPKQSYFIPRFILFSATTVAVLSLITSHFPSTTPVLSHIYSGVDTGSYQEEMSSKPGAINAEEGVTGRIQNLASWGGVSIAILCSFYPAISLFNPFYFGRFFMFILAWVGVFYSGHRTAVMISIAILFLTNYFRNGLLELTKLALVFLPLFTLLIVMNGVLFNLPQVVQRSLSFLPGNWSHAALASGKDSEEWRYDMWRRAMEGGLKGNHYIRNKILGDGFGVSLKEFNEVHSGADLGNEGQMIMGGFHNGPLSTIRFVGIVGLLLYYVLLIYLISYAIKLIRRSQNTPYYPITLFFAVPFIFTPFIYTFVAGFFDSSLPETILGIGMLKLLSNSLDDYEKIASDTIRLNENLPAGGSKLQMEYLAMT